MQGGEANLGLRMASESGGCDINDTLGDGNTWRNNRFGTKCGAATE